MSGRGLQDLCTISSYIDNSGLLVSSIYFKGELEAFETVNSGILLGDILSGELDTSEIDECEKFKLIESIISGEGELSVYLGLSSMEVSEVVRVIIYCYGDMDINAYSMYKPVKDYMETCAKNNYCICQQTWDMFCANFGLVLPERYKTFNYQDYEDNFYRPEPYLFYKENTEIIDLSDLSSQILTVCDCDNLGEIVISLLNEILESGFVLKRCEQCNRWFIPIKADEKYCSRSFDNLSCKQKAILEKRKVRQKSDLIGKAYNRVLTNLSNRVYATTITEEEQELRAERVQQFKIEYHEKRKAYKTGILLESDFLTWIESQK